MRLHSVYINDLSPDNADNLIKSCTFWPFSVMFHFCFKSSLALYVQRWAHFYIHTILSRLVGILALKPGLRNIGNIRIFFNFSVSFQYFFKWLKPLKCLLIATEIIYVYKSGPSVESTKLISIFKAKMGQDGRKSKWAYFY